MPQEQDPNIKREISAGIKKYDKRYYELMTDNKEDATKFASTFIETELDSSADVKTLEGVRDAREAIVKLLEDAGGIKGLTEAAENPAPELIDEQDFQQWKQAALEWKEQGLRKNQDEKPQPMPSLNELSVNVKDMIKYFEGQRPTNSVSPNKSTLDLGNKGLVSQMTQRFSKGSADTREIPKNPSPKEGFQSPKVLSTSTNIREIPKNPSPREGFQSPGGSSPQGAATAPTGALIKASGALPSVEQKHFDILGLKLSDLEGLDLGALRQLAGTNYRRLARENHPDKGGDRTLFDGLNEARDLILGAIENAENDGKQLTDGVIGRIEEGASAEASDLVEQQVVIRAPSQSASIEPEELSVTTGSEAGPLESEGNRKSSGSEVGAADEQDYYQILGVKPDATNDEIKKAYRALARKHHTDKKGGDKETMQSINVAYEVLSDSKSRAEYDAIGIKRSTPTTEVDNTQPATPSPKRGLVANAMKRLQGGASPSTALVMKQRVASRMPKEHSKINAQSLSLKKPSLTEKLLLTWPGQEPGPAQESIGFNISVGQPGSPSVTPEPGQGTEPKLEKVSDIIRINFTDPHVKEALSTQTFPEGVQDEQVKETLLQYSCEGDIPANNEKVQAALIQDLKSVGVESPEELATQWLEGEAFSKGAQEKMLEVPSCADVHRNDYGQVDLLQSKGSSNELQAEDMMKFMLNQHYDVPLNMTIPDEATLKGVVNAIQRHKGPINLGEIQGIDPDRAEKLRNDPKGFAQEYVHSNTAGPSGP